MNELIGAHDEGSLPAGVLVLKADLDSLLKLGYPGEQNGPLRASIADQYIESELRNIHCELSLSELTEEQITELQVKCRFYGSTELTYFLIQRKIPHDELSREEASTYIQDRLYLNDFNRIRHFDEQKSVKFSTYISRVINNLIIDFLRKKGLESKHSGVSEAILNDMEEQTDDHIERLISGNQEEQVNDAEKEIDGEFVEWVAHALLSENAPSDQTNKSLSERRLALREVLDISSKERIFLRALCYDDLNINQIRVLPGFEMSVNEAYQFYHQLMEKVVSALREVGLASEIQALVTDKVDQLDIEYAGKLIKTYITDVLYLQEADKERTKCHASLHGTLQEGVINERIKKLGKKHYRYFIPINSKTLVADRHVETVEEQPSRHNPTYTIRLRGLSEIFEVGARYSKFLPKIWLNSKKFDKSEKM